MRAPTLSLLLALFTLAGCFSGAPRADEDGRVSAGPLDASRFLAPEGEVAQAGDAVRILYKGEVRGNRAFEVTIPPEAILMRARYIVDGPGERGLSVYDPAIGANRCFTTSTLRQVANQARVTTCTGVTYLDTQGTRNVTYRLSIVGGRPQNSADLQSQNAPPSKFELTLEFLPGPLDGPAGLIDLSALAPRTYGLSPQKKDYVRSSIDNARLFVEINLPDGPGPWPTILISSPYNQPVRDAGGLTQASRVRDFVPRGYAVVSADVRGFANSEGCVDVWGPKEQQDQVDLVEWIAKQPWSNGKVAMYGQSYVGTTPHEAAVKRAPHLVTIATVAGLTDPYFDWHYGGVPNGESVGSPAGYSLVTAGAPPNPQQHMDDPLGWLTLARTTGCDLPNLMTGANQPNSVYGDYFRQRNFTDKARDIIVPVLYTQGYIDTNVKVTQALGFFNAIKTPKLGVFGPWLHRHPPRGDFDLILHAWMDRWVQGRETKVETLPSAQAVTNVDTVRMGTHWPSHDAGRTSFFLDGGQSVLSESKPASRWEGSYHSHAGALAAAQGQVDVFRFESAPLTDRLYISGEAKLWITARLEGSDNTHFGARLFDVDPNGSRVQVTFGMLNAGLRHGYGRFEPVPPGDTRFGLPMQPTEYVVEPGHKLVLTFGPSSSVYSATRPGRVTLVTGQADPTQLVLPTFEAPGDVVAPTSMFGFEAFR